MIRSSNPGGIYSLRFSLHTVLVNQIYLTLTKFIIEKYNNNYTAQPMHQQYIFHSGLDSMNNFGIVNFIIFNINLIKVGQVYLGQP